MLSINQINAAASIVLVTITSINLIIGAVGHIFNLIIFTRPSLRREPCSLYFLSSTCFNLFIVGVILPVRILSNGFNIDIANYNLGICKIETFAFYSARLISCWLIVFACIDRYLHSSRRVQTRRLSSLKTARWIIVITIIVNISFCSHMIVYFEISNVPNPSGNIVSVCNIRNHIYLIFMTIWFMILYSLCPSFFMLLFGSLTLNNIRHNNQIVHRHPEINRIRRRTDIQLFQMLISQVFVIIISTLPYFIYQLYALSTINVVKNTLRIAQENLAYQSVASITSFAHSTSFYLYTLSGTVFRKEFYKILRQCQHPYQNRVHIIGN